MAIVADFPDWSDHPDAAGSAEVHNNRVTSFNGGTAVVYGPSHETDAVLEFSWYFGGVDANFGGPFLRMNTSTGLEGIQARYSEVEDAWEIREWEAGSHSLIDSGGSILSAGDSGTGRLIVIGSWAQLEINGSVVASGVVTITSPGRIGWRGTGVADPATEGSQMASVSLIHSSTMDTAVSNVDSAIVESEPEPELTRDATFTDDFSTGDTSKTGGGFGWNNTTFDVIEYASGKFALYFDYNSASTQQLAAPASSGDGTLTLSFSPDRRARFVLDPGGANEETHFVLNQDSANIVDNGDGTWTVSLGAYDNGAATTLANAHADGADFKYNARSNTDGDSKEELRFSFNDTPEVAVEFDVYFPDGTESWGGADYVHRDVSPDNNKLLRLWETEYSSTNKVGCSTRRSTNDESNIRVEYRPNESPIGHWGEGGADDVTTGKHGVWQQVRWYSKMASGPDADDGIIRIWIDGILEYENTSLDIWSTETGRNNVFNSGYLFGHANSGFLDETIMLVTNWKFYDSEPAWPIFFDNFESGDLTHSAGGVSNSGTHTASVTNVDPIEGEYSVRLSYEADAPGDDSQAYIQWDIPDSSHIWMEYDLRIPANYKHRDDGGSYNNKFWQIYDNRQDEDVSYYVELSRTDDDSSHLRCVYDTDRNIALPFAKSKQTDEDPDPSGLQPPLPDDGLYINSDIHGTVIQVRVEAAVSSTKGTDDGIFRMWRDGTLFINRTDVPQYSSESGGMVFKTIRLMGWSNSGYDEETVFDIDNVKIYNTDPGWPAVPDFTDSFESGDLTHTENDMQWVGTGGASNGPSTETPRSGTYANRMIFTKSDPGKDSGWKERRFYLGAEYQTVWLDYWVHIPSNWWHHSNFHDFSFLDCSMASGSDRLTAPAGTFDGSGVGWGGLLGKHVLVPGAGDSGSDLDAWLVEVINDTEVVLDRTASTSVSNVEASRASSDTMNNKFILFWGAHEDAGVGGQNPGYTDDGINRPLITCETQANDVSEPGNSSLKIQIFGTPISSGTYAKVSDFVSHNGDYHIIGQWNRMQVKMKVASSETSQDGELGIWVNGNEAIYDTGLDIYPDGTDPETIAAWTHFYFMGATNTGMFREYRVNIDDVKIYTSWPGWG